jgi:hypothetical protein
MIEIILDARTALWNSTLDFEAKLKEAVLSKLLPQKETFFRSFIIVN